VIEIELPWFPAACSPNARSRSHWPKTNAMKKTRAWAYAATLASGGNAWVLDGAITVQTTFHPPSRRNHDEDNLKASCKGYYDGIAQALGVDDNLFRHAPVMVGEPVKNGKIVVVIGSVDER
jgi:crossover junction endodeoxyribonuclease RusA